MSRLPFNRLSEVSVREIPSDSPPKPRDRSFAPGYRAEAHCAGCGADITALVNPVIGIKYCRGCSRALHLARKKAAWRVFKAVQRGDLPKIETLQCVDCGQPARQYEHRDYSRPLEVEPVCHSCNALRGPALFTRPS